MDDFVRIGSDPASLAGDLFAIIVRSYGPDGTSVRLETDEYEYDVRAVLRVILQAALVNSAVAGVVNAVLDSIERGNDRRKPALFRYGGTSVD